MIKIIIKEKATLESYSKSDLIYNSNCSFSKYYRDSEKIDNLSSTSKHSFLANFFDNLDKFNKLKTHKEKTEKRKTNMYNTALELYNYFIGICFDEYYELQDVKRRKNKCDLIINDRCEPKHDPDKLFFKTYNYDAGLKIKNRLIKENWQTKKNLLIYHQCQH